jgi:hypothetical protein
MAGWAGILLGASLGVAWAVCFVPKFVGRDRRVTVRVVAIAAAYLACYIGLPLASGWSVLTSPSIPALAPPPWFAVATAVSVLAASAVLARLLALPASALPMWSVVFWYLTAWAPLRLHVIARAMRTAVTPGSVRDPAALDLAAIHALAIGMVLFLSVLLWVACARRPPGVVTLMSSGLLTCLALAAAAMVATVPRSGDESLMLWLFLLPAGLAAAIVALVTCVLAPIVSVARTTSRARRAQRSQQLGT